MAEPTAQDEALQSETYQRPPREGSTRLPPFPMVHIVKPRIGRKPITYDEVKALRKEMKSRMFQIDRQEKLQNDFKRTTQDFWRMDLDKLSKIGEDNRRHMAAAIAVYLGQTEGSNKAIRPLIRHIAVKPPTPQR